MKSDGIVESSCLGNFIKKFAIVDWIIVLIIVALAIFSKKSPFPSDFIPTISTGIDEPKKSVTVPVAVLYITIFFGGIILLISFGIICSTKITILMQTLASYCFSVVFTFLVVVLIQNMIGRPRPDTKSYCGGNGSFKDCTESLNTKQLTEQYRSFPSLPSAIAMAVGVFLTYFLIEIWSTYSLFQTFISLVPVCLALFVGACEIWDRNCHIEDVITGFVIGSLISFVTVKFFTQQVNERNEMKREESTSSSFRILFTN